MGKHMSNMDYFESLVRDIKYNKIGYIKGSVVANRIRKEHPEINISYDKEDRVYIATYGRLNKTSKEIIEDAKQN